MGTNVKSRRDQLLMKHPLVKMENQIINLLEDMAADYDEQAKSGTYLTYRLATAKHCASAKGILSVLAACEAYHLKEDIL